MSYFTVAAVFLLAAEIAMAAGIGYPSAAIGAPVTLIVVHMIVIGWLSLALTGALFQFIPVLVAKPLLSGALTLPALGLIVSGLLVLLFGFFALDHPALPQHHCLAIGGGLLVLGFLLAIFVLTRTLLSGWPLTLPACFASVGLASLLVTISLGFVFSVTLSGLVFTNWGAALLTQAVPIHAFIGLAGWLSFTAMGVSYRLLSMFMLAPELERKSSVFVFTAGAALLALAVFAGIYAAIVEPFGPGLRIAGVLGGAAVLVVYGYDVRSLFRRRRRVTLELNSRAAAAALIAFGLSTTVIAGLIAADRFDTIGMAAVYLFVFGWLSGLVLSQLYKIVPFLTWLESFGPILGKMPAPRVQDLVSEARGRWWFALYFAAVLAATVALGFAMVPFFRAAMVAQMIGTAGILFEGVRARRLYYAVGKFPSNLYKPRFLFCTTSPSSKGD
ncbi:MAG TPA: hypothetical protein VL026_05025 [Rhizomicrobium sp.]|nr:hypothetical protein [Rhizomicrobium sp.]